MTETKQKSRVHLSFHREDKNVAIVAYTRALKKLVDNELIFDMDENIHSLPTYPITSIDFTIILVSPAYLENEQELLQLVKRQKAGELRLLPVIVRPIEILPSAIAYQPNLPGDGKAVSDLNILEQDKLWAEMSSVVSSWLQRKNEKRLRTVTTTDDSPNDHDDKPDQNSQPRKKDVRGHIFISHAHDDGYFAQVLKHNIENHGYKAWIDIDMIEAGANWKQEIDDNIYRSFALILVMSPDAKHSEYVTYEWAYALGLGKPVIPLLLKQTSLHPRLANYQYLNFTHRQACPWDNLIERLNSLHEGDTTES